jgi:3-oxoacyl-[acyl-carrier protein] reductase
MARSHIAAKGVTVNNLLPGAFYTDRLKSNFATNAEKSGKSVDEVTEARRKSVPAQRFGTPEEFGRFMASENRKWGDATKAAGIKPE